MYNETPRVGIVGAGITGLALTHYLAGEGIESIAFEASDEPGGVISSRTVDGHVLEVGPQRMRKTPGVATLAEAAGVEDAIVEADEGDLYVYAGGRLGEGPLSARQFLRTDLLSWRGKLRLLAEPLTRPGHPAESVAELFTRKFGREAYERFAGPLYGGLYGSDPAEMPAAFALEGLLEREKQAGSLLQAFRKRVGQGHEAPPITFERGNQQLPNALAATYRDRVELGTPVTGIEPASGADQQTDRDAGYVLHTPRDTHEVDVAVVTTPASVTAELLGDIVPSASRLDELRYNPLAMVFIESAFDGEGKGYQVGYDEDLHTLGVSFNHSLFGREGLSTAFLGGMHEPDLVEQSDEELGHIATSEFEMVTGAPASTVHVARLDPGFPAWDHSWWTLEDLELPPDLFLATNYTERMGIPSRVREARELAGQFADRLDDRAPAEAAGTVADEQAASADD
jgi:oxygen-dependent protoporphyrinogen oxidase